MNEHTSNRGSATPWLLFLLTLAGLGAGAWFGWGELQAERARSAAQAKQLTEAQVRLAEADASRRGLDERVKALEAEKANLAASNSELSENLEQAQAELAELKATYDSLQDKLQAEIKKGEIHLSQSEGRIQVDLVDKVLFDSGKAELSPRGVEVLTRLGGVLAGVDDKLVQVSGHTDDSPIVNDLKEKYPTNWELSTARAVNVVRFLSEKAGVSPKRLVAAGHGQYQPVASNATARGRAQNRRIEILLLPLISKHKAKVEVATAEAKPGAHASSVRPASAKRPAPNGKTRKR